MVTLGIRVPILLLLSAAAAAADDACVGKIPIGVGKCI